MSVFGRSSMQLAAVLAAAVLIPRGGAEAAGLGTATVLYSFCTNHISCLDGANPQAGLVRDGVGRLYGTTNLGGTPRPNGTPGFGTVFVLTPNATKTKWTETVLHNFCPGARKGCADGTRPLAGLIRDSQGRLYGTTSSGGGLKNAGTVFVVTPNAAGTKWTESVLHRFCSRAGCADGATPKAALLIDKQGNLYGTTSAGGASPGPNGMGRGTVFELIPNAAGTAWTEKVLYSFCVQPRCADGANPLAGLIMDQAGNLYGTTFHGGRGNRGTVFELTPNAARTRWTETVLYRFCSKADCADGEFPQSTLLLRAGLLYGTTGGSLGAVPHVRTPSQRAGGSDSPTAASVPLATQDFRGNVFVLTPNAARSKWTETVLYSFCVRPNCVDGDTPRAGVIADQAGHLYGTTADGGRTVNAVTRGLVFELVPNAAKTKWAERILYRFCSVSNSRRKCTDGDTPHAGVIMDRSGHLYGTTAFGGAGGAGVVYQLP